jgi:hypothetical protein
MGFWHPFALTLPDGEGLQIGFGLFWTLPLRAARVSPGPAADDPNADAGNAMFPDICLLVHLVSRNICTQPWLDRSQDHPERTGMGPNKGPYLCTFGTLFIDA